MITSFLSTIFGWAFLAFLVLGFIGLIIKAFKAANQ